MSLRKIITTKIGFGTAPMGNMYRNIPEEEAQATLQAAWDAGVRYFDTASLYGAGLAESRLGEMLKGKDRDSYVISTKVGHTILDEKEDPTQRDFGEKSNLFQYGNSNKVQDEYTAEGISRSIEGSLKRLNTDRLDIVWVHDLAQDFLGDKWIDEMAVARTGAFRELSKMREEGIIKGWGLGVNRTEPIELTLQLDEPNPDGFLLAGRYSLLDHSHALQRLLPLAQEQNVDMVVGGPYSSGILAGGKHFEYVDAPQEIIDRVQQLLKLTEKYGISIKSAALQFSLAHPASVAVIPGASKPSRIAEDQAALAEVIPADFWRELIDQKLVDLQAPLPINNK